MPFLDNSSCKDRGTVDVINGKEAHGMKHHPLWFWVTWSPWVHGFICAEAVPRSTFRTNCSFHPSFRSSTHPPNSIASGSTSWCSTETRMQEAPSFICNKSWCNVMAVQAKALVCLQKGQLCASLHFRSVPLNLQFRDCSSCLKDNLLQLQTVLEISHSYAECNWWRLS